MRTKTAKPAITFGLGSQIAYTQRAAVARHHTKNGGYWGLHEGWSDREGTFLARAWEDRSIDERLQEFNPGDGINKAIFTWDEAGSGTVVGLVKRGIGKSVTGSYRSSYDGDDYEPGWFEPREWRWFYTVRHALYGTDYILVPVENAEAAR